MTKPNTRRPSVDYISALPRNFLQLDSKLLKEAARMSWNTDNSTTSLGLIADDLDIVGALRHAQASEEFSTIIQINRGASLAYALIIESSQSHIGEPLDAYQGALDQLVAARQDALSFNIRSKPMNTFSCLTNKILVRSGIRVDLDIALSDFDHGREAPTAMSHASYGAAIISLCMADNATL